jgi:hypothetical protein
MKHFPQCPCLSRLWGAAVVTIVAAAVVSPAVAAHGDARDSPSEASSSGVVHTAPGIDPVCATLKETLLNSPPDGPINWDDYNDLVWSDPPQGPRHKHKHKTPPSNAPLKPVVLPRELSYASESDFDFFNNGRITRVFRNIFGDHYMRGSTLLVEPEDSSKEPTDDPIHDPAAWFLPCQLQSLEIRISDCAPLSQKNDQAGFSVADIERHRLVRFVGRYSNVDAVRIRGTTYVIIVGHEADTAGYAAVLKPRPGRSFDLLCLLRREAAL